MPEPPAVDANASAQPEFDRIEADSRPRWLAYLELLRLPNVFTAMADILLGYLLTHEDLRPVGTFAALLLSSSLLYLAGMVLNDVFDRDQDARERPSRPIPSSRVRLSTAQRMGWLMWLLGIALGWIAAWLAQAIWPGVAATVLAGLVVAYDAGLKRTVAAPVGMGACRMLNVLLGASAAPWWPAHIWTVAAGLGIYVAGITWFARTEARISARPQLGAALAVMLAGLAVVAWYPWWSQEPNRFQPPEQWAVVWVIFGLILANRAMRAVFDPRPALVQMAVKGSILAIIIIDAMALFGFKQQAFWPIVVVSLLVPTLVLGRWVYST